MVVFLVIRSEGLFRISGCATRKSDLRHRLCQGTLIDFEQEHYTHNDASDVLKNFLAELPDPLLSAVHFPVYVRISGKQNKFVYDDHIRVRFSDFETTTQQSMKDGEQLTANARRLNIVRLLIQCLPVENRQLLRLLLTLFKRIVEHSEQNKMTAANLGILFVPVLMHPKSVSDNGCGCCKSLCSGHRSECIATMHEHQIALDSHDHDDYACRSHYAAAKCTTARCTHILQ
jgi:hypothetical protein